MGQAPARIERLARLALVAALALAVFGKVLERSGLSPFWGGLFLAFGEAALVGGLADWFAVRALFVHPFGIPFPHTALIPRNRQRIVQEIGQLVQHEWLPPSLFKAKIATFDFVGSGLMPVVEPLRPHLRELLRSAALDVLNDLSPHQVSLLLARGLAGAVDAERIGPFLGDLARRARDQHWLEPLLREWIGRLLRWAQSQQSRAVIHGHLRDAAGAYRERGWFKKVTYNVAERFGGIDLEAAAEVLQDEVRRFAASQLEAGSEMQQMVQDGLEAIERRLHEDPAFLEDIKGFLLETSEAGSLTVLLEPVLTSLRAQARQELEAPGAPVLDNALARIDAWLKQLAENVQLREQINAWCRRLATQLVEQHHSLVGALVEEQLNRLSDENLAKLIEAKVGEDLNWIRLNGSFVGGIVGVVLYLALHLVGWLTGGGASV
jgi:uncharacterized membrane-anchored protein YjiN (DUF445 family)